MRGQAPQNTLKLFNPLTALRLGRSRFELKLGLCGVWIAVAISIVGSGANSQAEICKEIVAENRAELSADAEIVALKESYVVRPLYHASGLPTDC